jgi:hypothetical protein
VPGFATHCCVYAVAHSVDEPPPFIDPSGQTFWTVLAHVLSDNDVAQRNLDIVDCPRSSLLPLSLVLPWVQVANPFEPDAAVQVEIDATAAQGFERLQLEVDGQMLDELIPLGRSRSLSLPGLLRRGQHKVLRLHADLRASLRLGAELPIDLHLRVGEWVDMRYQHLLRVVPPVRAAVQVLDGLYGALHTVAEGFGSDPARALAEDVRAMLGLVRQSKAPTEALAGGWDRLRSEFDRLARSLERAAGGEAACGEICTQLRLLAHLAPPNQASLGTTIEQVRERADRIQERAGRRVPRV